MTRNSHFEIVEIAGDHMAIPVGEEAVSFHGVVALSEAAAFLLKKLDEPQTRDSLVDLLLDEYDIDRPLAERDVDGIIQTFTEYNLITDS